MEFGMFIAKVVLNDGAYGKRHKSQRECDVEVENPIDEVKRPRFRAINI